VSSSTYTLEEILALNDEIISLSKAQLPLDPYLKQIAHCLKGRQRQMAEDVSALLSEGKSLDIAITEVGADFPPAYQAVLQAGLKSGHLTAALEDITRTARRVQFLKTSYTTAAIYPAILMILTGLFASTVGKEQLLAMQELVDGAMLPSGSGVSRWIEFFLWINPLFWCLMPLGGLLLLMIVAVHFVPASWLWSDGPIGYLLPGLRGVARHSQWATVFDLMSLLLKRGVALPEAIELSTRAAGSKRLARAGMKWANEIRSGNIESIPRELNPMSRWLLGSHRNQGLLAESLKLLSQRHHNQALRRCRWMQRQLPIYFSIIFGMTSVVAYGSSLMIPWLGILLEVFGESATF